ncbi:MAG: excinuclease ABC subunit UvrC [Chloroflexota bacterium]
MKSKQLELQAKALPTKPGVYLLKDENGNVLYVGKAASLRHRVRSYFGPSAGLTPKLQKMMALVSDLETIVTDSEQEALILESILIKRHRPPCNVVLKDDKSYPYLKITVNDDWPRVQITRRLERDGSRYFGPFASAGSIRTAMKVVRKIFPYCSCSRPIRGPGSRPCLAYHLRLCPGITVGAVSQEENKENIRQLTMFLEGKQEQVVRQLRRKMEDAAGKMEFERAAVLRDQVRAVENVMEQQKVAVPLAGDQDIVALAQAKDEACIQVFFVKEGRLIGREHFLLKGTRDEEPGQIMASFLKQFYSSAPQVPPTILLQHLPEDVEVIKSWLESQRGGRVAVKVPARGEKRRFVDMVAENARQVLEKEDFLRLADSEKTAAALAELQDKLGLSRPLKRIECYDVSNIMGTSAVGSMVVFQDGLRQPSHYRRFRIKTVAGADDYAMLREVLGRRFKRVAVEDAHSSWAVKPDLVLIDGGKGQLSAAMEGMRNVGADSVPVASIAKENEEVFLPGRRDSLVLPRDSQSLYLLQRIRDEAHRFAISYHLRVRQKGSVASALDSVPGIGPKRKRALLKKFGSVRAIKEAQLEEIAAVPGMTKPAAAKVKEYL